MAHLNQSKTSDDASSLRQDPYGTSLLFDSYDRAGYQVKRSQDEKSLADQDATRTTAFFIGGYDYADVETRDGKLVKGGKFHGLLEDFLARGGRVVLIQHETGVSVASIPEPSGKPKSGVPKWQKEKGWRVENGYNLQENTNIPPLGPSQVPRNAGGKRDHVSHCRQPWLKTDEQWNVLYAGP